MSAVAASSFSAPSKVPHFAPVEKEAWSLYTDARALKTTCATGDKDKLCEDVAALDTRISECLKIDSFEYFDYELTAVKPLLNGIVSVANGQTSPGVLTVDQDLALRCHGIGCALLSVFVIDLPQQGHLEPFAFSRGPELCQYILQHDLHPNYARRAISSLFTQITTTLNCKSEESNNPNLAIIEIFCKAGASLHIGLLQDIVSHQEGPWKNRIVQTLLSFGVNPNTYSDLSLPQVIASSDGNRVFSVPDSVISTLLDGGMNINHQRSNAQPPLLTVFLSNNLFEAARFIAAGAHLSFIKNIINSLSPATRRSLERQFATLIIVQAQEARKEIESLQYTPTQTMDAIMHVEKLKGAISRDTAMLISEYAYMRQSDIFEMTMLRLFPDQPLTK